MGSWSFAHFREERRIAELEKDELESQLLQAKKFEAIGTMAGGIAHNFNTILASVLGYADMAMDEISKESTAHKDLEKMLISVNRAKDLVIKIMKISQHDLAIKEKCRPDILLYEVFKSIKVSIPKTIKVEESISGDVGLVNIDPLQFKEVVENLCMNALAAMKGSEGVLGIILENIEIKKSDIVDELALEPGNFVKLTIGDTGHGISSEHIKRIFDPFFTTKNIGEGDGIGLSIAHGIVQKSGGMITVESQPEKGSAFHLFLPVAEQVQYKKVASSS